MSDRQVHTNTHFERCEGTNCPCYRDGYLDGYLAAVRDFRASAEAQKEYDELRGGETDDAG